MKIQKVLSRIYNGKKYYKHIIVLPEENIKKSKLKEGDELTSEIKNFEIKLKKK